MDTPSDPRATREQFKGRKGDGLHRLLSDEVDDLAWLVDDARVTVEVNQRWSKFTGLSAEETRLSGWESVAHPDDVAAWRARQRWNRRVGDGFRLQVRLKDAMGAYVELDARTTVESFERGNGSSLIWVVSARPTRTADRLRLAGFPPRPFLFAVISSIAGLAFLYLLGLTLNGVAGGILLCVLAASCFVVGRLSALGFSGRPRNTDDFESLRESNRRLVLALKGAKDSLWDRDLVNGRLYRSNRWKELRGYEPHEFGDDPEDWERSIHPEDVERVRRAFQDHVDGKTALFNEEYRILRKDGTCRWILDRGEAIRDRNGKATRISGFETDITERKEAERELLETRGRFEAIISSAMDAIISIDDKFRVIIFNAAAEKLFGVKSEEVMGGKIDRFLPERIRGEHEVLMTRFGEEPSGTRRMTSARLLTALRADGSEFPIEASISSIKLGNRRLYTVILRDVTERVRTERLLARHAEALEMVAAGSPLSEVLGKVCETVEVLSKDSICSVLLLDQYGLLRTAAAPNLPPDYTRAIDMGVPIGPDYGSCGTAVYRRELVVVSDTYTDPLWTRYRDLATTFGLRSCWSSPVLNAAREPIGTFAIYSKAQRVPTSQDLELIDATAHLVGIAVEAHRAREARRESEERFRLAIEAGRLGTFRHDFKSNLVQYDARAREYRGFTKELLTVEEAIANLHPDDRDRVTEAIRRAHRGEANEGYAVEERVILPDGSIRWLSVFANLHFQGSGSDRRAMLAIGTIQDITERKRAEEVLRENDRRKSEFLAMLGHELRNPLAAITNAVEVLKLKGSNETDREWSRDVIERQMVQLTRLVDDLLDLSRISRGKINLKKVHLDSREAIRRASETVRKAVTEKKHRFSVDLPDDPLAIEFDEARLQQVLSNLLTNAIKYTDPGGSIRVSASREGDFARIRVEDNGIGIARENLGKIFSLFSQVEAAMDRSEGGLGIGLTLVQTIVELHGGRVSVESEGLGRGSVFEILIPVVESTRAAGGVGSEPSSGPSGVVKILVVDDNVDTAVGLARLLRLSGFEARVEHDGAKALRAVEEFAPEVVVSDIGLPGMDGHALASRIREARGDGVRLIAVSGYGQEADREEGLRSGFDRYLTKPVDFQALLRTIAEIQAP